MCTAWQCRIIVRPVTIPVIARRIIIMLRALIHPRAIARRRNRMVAPIIGPRRIIRPVIPISRACIRARR